MYGILKTNDGKVKIADPCILGKVEYADQVLELEFTNSRVDIQTATVKLPNEDEGEDGSDMVDVEVIHLGNSYPQSIVEYGEKLEFEVGVDTGQIAVIASDLLWLPGGFDNEIQTPPFTVSNDYEMACLLTLRADGGMWQNNQAAVVPTVYGDSTGSVWVKRDDEGKIIGAVITLKE